MDDQELSELDEEPNPLDEMWPFGFRRDDMVVMPLGMLDLPGDHPHFAMLLAICRNTAVIADRLDQILKELRSDR